ncbi:MAG: hypothetical protein A2143_03110 [Gallionellales bacterium RBG_16_57_15]|nr:MAG: hypothetical protein A2143_03110 [Gallionellales bacterium RBG_16_57_15]
MSTTTTTTTTTKNYYWRIAGFYFFYYAFVGMFAPYWSLYLRSIHFDAIEIAKERYTELIRNRK